MPLLGGRGGCDRRRVRSGIVGACRGRVGVLAALPGEREVARLVPPGGLRVERLDAAVLARRTRCAGRRDRVDHRPRAVVLQRVRRWRDRAGRRPTGSRICSSDSRVPTCTTAGCPAMSVSPIGVSSVRSSRSNSSCSRTGDRSAGAPTCSRSRWHAPPRACSRPGAGLRDVQAGELRDVVVPGWHHDRRGRRRRLLHAPRYHRSTSRPRCSPPAPVRCSCRIARR